MGRNKYSQSEFDAIARLLSLKGSANRAKQKEIRHQLRVGYEFNISDFNEPGKAFGSVVAGDVDGLGLDLAGGFGAEGFEGLLAASGGSDPPSCADAEPGDFESDARCGAHDDDTFHGGLIFRVSHTEYTKGMPEKQIFPEKRKNPGGFSLSYRFFPGFGFSPWSGVSNSVRCSAVSRAGAMRSR